MLAAVPRCCSCGRAIAFPVMSDTAAYRACEQVFKTTKQIFHDDVGVLSGATTPAGLCSTFGNVYRTNPVTFVEQPQHFYGAERRAQRVVGRKHIGPAWLKAYETEHNGEFRDPHVCTTLSDACQPRG